MALENGSKFLVKNYFSKMLVSVTHISDPLQSAPHYSVHVQALVLTSISHRCIISTPYVPHPPHYPPLLLSET